MDRKIQIDNNIDRTELFGNLDSNLALIKEATDVDVFQRDDGLVLKTQETICRMNRKKLLLTLPAEIIDEFMNIIASGENLSSQKASYVVGLKKEGLSYRESNIAKDIICFTHEGKPLKPKTIGQKVYVDGIRKNDVVFGIGPAGTGKTYIAVAMAVNAFKNKEIQKIILTRPAVEAGERLGFLPGDLQEKGGPVSQTAVRRSLRCAGQGERVTSKGEGIHRGRTAGLYERPYTGQLLHNTGRSSKYNQRADEDVPYKDGLRF